MKKTSHRRKSSPAVHPSPKGEALPAPQQLSSRRRAAFYGVALLTPLLLLLAAEGVLRVACNSCKLPLFVSWPSDSRYQTANRSVGERWFAAGRPGAQAQAPPAPMREPFAAEKPQRSFRVFVLGESSAAGFPYPRNGAFSRLVRDVLRDLLPDDSVEVVNLGIAATNSFTLLDMTGEIARRRPDAVLIYGGHNEYYGVLGVGAREQIPGASVVAVRGYLRLLRSSLVLALRRGIPLLRLHDKGGVELETASMMEALGRDQEIAFGSRAYHEGVRQFETNLEDIVKTFRRNGIPVFIGSLSSNLRDLEPFAAAENDLPGGAREAFRLAHAALAAGDSAWAREQFIRARDLDVVRFRAPSEFNAVIKRVASRTGAIHVPVTEAFDKASPAGVPGANLFLEHVHPNREGYALIAQAFLTAIQHAGVLGRQARTEHLRPWEEYVAGTTLTPLDERIAFHMKRTLESTWPFVPPERRWDYRGVYQPVDLLDSLALHVSRGAPWEQAKLQMAASYESREQFDSAAAEYAGLARDALLFDEPLRLQGRALMLAGRSEEADRVFRRALSIRPTPVTLNALGWLAAERGDAPSAVHYFRQSIDLDPGQPAALYQLSLLYGMTNNIAAARETAGRLARLAPDYPGLSEWLETLSGRR